MELHRTAAPGQAPALCLPADYRRYIFLRQNNYKKIIKQSQTV